MLAKDMFLKNKKKLYKILFVVFFLYSLKSYSDTSDKIKILNHLNSLKNFSASFIQIEGENLSEGKVFIGKERIRAEYISPTKILIILDEDKAMYYNYELDEDEFFNPKKTNAWFFYDVFRNPLFFQNSSIKTKKNEIVLEKKGVDSEDRAFLIRIFFEKNPLILRGFEVLINNDLLKLSIFNHNYNEIFDKRFFKLINPKFFN